MIKQDLIKNILVVAQNLDNQKQYAFADKVSNLLTKVAQYDDDYGYDDDDRLSELEGIDDYNRFEEKELDRDRFYEREDQYSDEVDDENYLTIERGQGETYNSPSHTVTLYKHGVYPEGSVLEGQPRREWIEMFEDFPTKEENIKAAQEYAAQNYPGMRVEVSNWSSYQKPYLDHLRDDDDYPMSFDDY